MKISRFFKTILMTDFLGGLFIAIKEIFKASEQENMAKLNQIIVDRLLENERVLV